MHVKSSFDSNFDLYPFELIDKMLLIYGLKLFKSSPLLSTINKVLKIHFIFETYHSCLYHYRHLYYEEPNLYSIAYCIMYTFVIITHHAFWSKSDTIKKLLLIVLNLSGKEEIKKLRRASWMVISVTIVNWIIFAVSMFLWWIPTGKVTLE